MKRQSSFGRKTDSRNLLLRNLATSVILYESVVTTEAKGKAVQPIIDRLIRIAQTRDRLTARRLLASYIPDEKAIAKLLDELVGRFSGQTSGFTRRYRMPARKGDGAPQVVIQLTKTVLIEEPKAAKPSTKKNAPATEKADDQDKNEPVETETGESHE